MGLESQEVILSPKVGAVIGTVTFAIPLFALGYLLSEVINLWDLAFWGLVVLGIGAAWGIGLTYRLNRGINSRIEHDHREAFFTKAIIAFLFGFFGFACGTLIALVVLVIAVYILIGLALLP